MTLRHSMLAAALAFGATAVAAAPVTAEPTPTIVLVHGAFADTSSWQGVADALRADGFRVVVPDNPLRGPAADAASVQRSIDSVRGPVVLVGHSYGGSVITQVQDARVRALVYVAAFAPAHNEINQSALDPVRFPGSRLLPPVLLAKPVEGPSGPGVDVYIAEQGFHGAFAQDVSDDVAADMLGHQRSLALTANLEPSGPPAWRTTPSWYLVSADDRVIPAASQRFMAARMNARTAEIDAGHASPVSRPTEVAAFVRDAAVG